jgi:peptidoglycan/xylan/chitin deacetylase (PgdA/CDA1 family)
MPKLTVCLTFDLDGMSPWIGSAKSNNPSVLSRGEFTVVGTPRVLALLATKNIPATFYIPGHTAYAFPDLVKQIRDAGHEIGHHGWVHENPASFDRAGEQRVLERGLEALQRVAAVRPVGYRSPAWDLSKDSLLLLREFGFRYDSSCMAGDFVPYYARTGDSWGLDEPYKFGEILDLVELPVNWALDDVVAFETYLGLMPGYVAPRAVETMWRDDFDFAAEECADGVFTLTMHPQCIGRGSRIRMLERLIDHMQGTADVEFATMKDYATGWAAKNPVNAWKDKNPLRCGVGAITSV